MADPVRIDQLPEADPLDGSELVPVQQGGTTRRTDGLASRGYVDSVASQFIPMGEVVVEGDDAAAIQTKADACAAAGTSLGIPDGEWTGIDTTIVIECDVQASSGAKFVGAADPLIQVGDGVTNLAHKRIVLPRVERTSRAWSPGTITDDVGVRVDRSHSCFIVVPYVNKFGVGLLFTGDNVNAYHHVVLGHLSDNAVNLRIAPTADGYCNEINWHGGRFSHASGHGTGVAGTRHIEIQFSSSNLPNSHRFYGPSVEGHVQEFALDAEARHLRIIEGRWEGSPRVRYTGFARHNLIDRGFGAQNIEVIDTSWMSNRVIAAAEDVAQTGPSRAVDQLDDIIAWDTFNRPDGPVGKSDSNHTWESFRAASWEIVDGRVKSNYASTGWEGFVLDVGESDVDLSFTAILGDTDDRHGACFRGLDVSNYLAVRLRPTAVDLFKVSGGLTSLATEVVPAFISERAYRVRVKAVGPNIDVWIDGLHVLHHELSSADESEFESYTKHGFRDRASSAAPKLYDDLVIRRCT